MAAAGVPLRTLQEWMGHRDFKTTLIYADYAPAEREARAGRAGVRRRGTILATESERTERTAAR